MQITVIAPPQVSSVPTAKGSYEVLEVTYKDSQGKVGSKKLMSFNAKVVFPILKKAQIGETFDVTTVKNDKGFWDWTAASILGSGGDSTPFPTLNTETPAPVKSTFAGKTTSTYATPEERAMTQIYIVRQSSITAALKYLEGKDADVSEVISLASRFEDFVFNGVKEASTPPVKAEVSKKPAAVKKTVTSESFEELESLDDDGFPE